MGLKALEVLRERKIKQQRIINCYIEEAIENKNIGILLVRHGVSMVKNNLSLRKLKEIFCRLSAEQKVWLLRIIACASSYVSDEVTEILELSLREKDFNVRKEASQTVKRLGLDDLLRKATEYYLPIIPLVLPKFSLFISEEEREFLDKRISKLAQDIQKRTRSVSVKPWRSLIEALKSQSEFTKLIAIKMLTKKLKDKNPSVRSNAVKVLVKALEEESSVAKSAAIEAIIKALKDEDLSVKLTAIVALSGIDSELVITALSETLRTGEMFVTQLAAQALAITGSKKAIEELLKALGSEEYLVREAVVKVLFSLGVMILDGSLPKEILEDSLDSWKKSFCKGNYEIYFPFIVSFFYAQGAFLSVSPFVCLYCFLIIDSDEVRDGS